MTYFVTTTRAGYPAVTDGSGVHDAMPSYLAATDEAQRRNRVLARVQAKRAAREIAQTNLGRLAKRLGCGLRIMPDVLPSSTAIAHPTESAVCA